MRDACRIPRRAPRSNRFLWECQWITASARSNQSMLRRMLSGDYVDLQPDALRVHLSHRPRHGSTCNCRPACRSEGTSRVGQLPFVLSQPSRHEQQPGRRNSHQRTEDRLPVRRHSAPAMTHPRPIAVRAPCLLGLDQRHCNGAAQDADTLAIPAKWAGRPHGGGTTRCPAECFPQERARSLARNAPILLLSGMSRSSATRNGLIFRRNLGSFSEAIITT